jgi:hypothetical protein
LLRPAALAVGSKRLELEVVIPVIASRVEKTHKLTRMRLNRADVAPLPRVAPQAGVRKVYGVRPATMFAANDVIDLMRRIRVTFMDEAILASLFRTLGNRAADGVADVTSQAECVAAPAPSPSS